MVHFCLLELQNTLYFIKIVILKYENDYITKNKYSSHLREYNINIFDCLYIKIHIVSNLYQQKNMFQTHSFLYRIKKYGAQILHVYTVVRHIMNWEHNCYTLIARHTIHEKHSSRQMNTAPVLSKLLLIASFQKTQN